MFIEDVKPEDRKYDAWYPSRQFPAFEFQIRWSEEIGRDILEARPTSIAMEAIRACN